MKPLVTVRGEIHSLKGEKVATRVGVKFVRFASEFLTSVKASKSEKVCSFYLTKYYASPPPPLITEEGSAELDFRPTLASETFILKYKLSREIHFAQC